MSYCQNKSKAIVIYYKLNGVQERLVYSNVPIQVQFNSSELPDCWRFYGTGDNAFIGNPPDKQYELFASGINPGFKLNSGHNSRGYTPTMNGVLLRGEGYWYRSNYGFERVNLVTPTTGYNSSGSCKSSNQSGCEIVVTDSKNNTYRDSALCDKKFSVTCDQECPPGHLRCLSNNYPGYCCIPCSLIASRINSMRARL